MKKIAIAFLAAAALFTALLPILAFAGPEADVVVYHNLLRWSRWDLGVAKDGVHYVADPEPERTRRDNRPSATPNPEHPILAIDPIPSFEAPMFKGERARKVAFTCRRVDPDSGVNRCRSRGYRPGQAQVPKTPSDCEPMVSLVRDGVGTGHCLFTWKARRGLWTFCAYSPDEPGAAYHDLQEGCTTVEVR